MSDPVPPRRPARAESRQLLELRQLRDEHPELAQAIDLHLELLELERRIQGRVPLPQLELNAAIVARHASRGEAMLRFEGIPLEPSDLRLMVRQTADILHRFEALDEADYQVVQALGRDATLPAIAEAWYRRPADALVAAAGVARAGRPETGTGEGEAVDQVLTQAMRPFLSRCAEVLQRRDDLSLWTHPHCALCAGEPDLAVITPAAERHLICSRCTLRWNFEPLTCPYCGNGDRSQITSFATPDGRYRVYGCDVCRRYLKAYDARHATRPVMPVVDRVATLPLDAAAMQRGYGG